MNFSKLSSVVCFSILALAAPAVAGAHPGHDGPDLTWDFQGGFLHPLSGWDHLVAMVAVGIWAAQLGGRARFLVPTCFVAIMSLAALAGRAGMIFPGIEVGIAVSVLALGLLIARSTKLPLFTSATIVAIFAAFHGCAHGAEAATFTHPTAFGLGFIAATGLLHLVGYAFGALSIKFSANVARLAGWGIAAAGFTWVLT